MSVERDKQYFLDMLDSAKRAVKYTSGKTEAEFLADPMLQDAVSWRIIIIAEAASRISPEIRAAIQDIPWRAMKGMRNRLIHEYDNVRVDIVWDTVQINLLPLVQAVEKFLHS